MARAFRLIYASPVSLHLRAIEKKYYSMIRKGIESMLLFEPNVESRNRKPLKQPSPYDATWEIRFGPHNRFRVFYEIDEAHREVYILAIGVKRGNRLTIGKEEVSL